jgi:hypothetical protein
MSRDEGFAVMDVSVDVANDPKVRKLFRHAPDHAPVAFMAYIATLGESWRSGRRVNVDDAWPSSLPFSRSAVDALVHVRLLDARGMVPAKSWRMWFDVARERRQKARDRWARYNAGRYADTTPPPRGSDADTATSVPPVRPSVPPEGVNEDVERHEPARARGPVLVHPERTA